MPYGIQYPNYSNPSPGGTDMASVIVGPAIGAGASIAQGLIGKSAQNNAAKAQAEAQRQALALQKEQLNNQKQVDQYAMAQAHENQQRNALLGNSLLRSYGVTGLTDPRVNYDALNAPPPSITGTTPSYYSGYQPAAPRQPVTLGQLAGAQAGLPVVPGAPPAPVTLGRLFGTSPAVRRM